MIFRGFFVGFVSKYKVYYSFHNRNSSMNLESTLIYKKFCNKGQAFYIYIFRILKNDGITCDGSRFIQGISPSVKEFHSSWFTCGIPKHARITTATVNSCKMYFAIIRVQFSLMIIFNLLKSGKTGEMFIFLRSKSLQQTLHSFEMISSVSSNSHQHCALVCHQVSQCVAADFEGESNLCRLYNGINGKTTIEKEDILLIKNVFGVSKFSLNTYRIPLVFF